MDTQNFNKDPNLNDQNPAQKNGGKEKLTHKVGDAIEHLGDYVGDKISKNIGEKIREAGDKIEHSQD